MHTSLSVFIALLVLGLAAAVLVGAPSARSEDDPKATLRSHVEWVKACLDDFKALEPGLTRDAIEKRWPMDGGLHMVSQVRFMHPNCMYFKVDVTFAFQREPEGQKRGIWGPKDKATKISKPYLEVPYAD